MPQANKREAKRSQKKSMAQPVVWRADCWICRSAPDKWCIPNTTPSKPSNHILTKNMPTATLLAYILSIHISLAAGIAIIVPKTLIAVAEIPGHVSMLVDATKYSHVGFAMSYERIFH